MSMYGSCRWFMFCVVCHKKFLSHNTSWNSIYLCDEGQKILLDLKLEHFFSVISLFLISNVVRIV